MLTKILFTVLVIVLVVAVTRFRSRQLAQPGVRRAAPLPPVARAPRLIAYGAAAFIAVTSAIIYYERWSAAQRVVTIRVVNTRTGESVTYKAHKGSIEENRFKTLDGWTVRVSENERVEMSGQD